MFNEKFNLECLQAHNELRSLHDASSLRLNPAIAESAQDWADKLAETGRLQHSPDSGDNLGESLAVRWSSGRQEFDGQQVTEQWYGEISQYRFDEENQLNCGNFSQLVWRNTTDAGFGRATSASGKIFVVGQYFPAGNIINEWRQNVLPPSDEQSQQSEDQISEESERLIEINEEFNEQCLLSHNKYRELHDARPLTYDPMLARSAQEWANQLALVGALKHSPDSEGKVGENVGMKWSSKGGNITGQRATDQWYNESKHYNYDKENQLNCGHFSQVVWRSTRRAGFGKAFGNDGKLFVVGQYSPPGNYRNRWRENVLPPGGRPSSSASIDSPRSFNDSLDGDSRDRRSRGSESIEYAPEELDDFNEECLEAHNRCRRRHGAPDLRLSARLILSAQSWAEKLVESGTLTHSPSSGSKIGENVGMKWSSRGSNINGEQATNQWYKESKIYNFDKENQLNCGHFSQVVWRSTREVGFGKARASSGKIFVVAHYHPPGNYRDRWRENVKRPLLDFDEDSYLSRSTSSIKVPSLADELAQASDNSSRSPEPRVSSRSPDRSFKSSLSLSSRSDSPSFNSRHSPNPSLPTKIEEENEEELVEVKRTAGVHSAPSRQIEDDDEVLREREREREERRRREEEEQEREREREERRRREEEEQEREREREERRRREEEEQEREREREEAERKRQREAEEERRRQREAEEERRRQREAEEEERRRKRIADEKERKKREEERSEAERMRQKEDTDEEWERPPEFQRKPKVKGLDSRDSSLRQPGQQSTGMNGESSMSNGDVKERPRRKIPILMRSPSPTDPDDKYFRGPSNPADVIISRKLMRRNDDSNIIHLTIAEIFERPNKTRYVIIGSAKESITGRMIY